MLVLVEIPLEVALAVVPKEEELERVPAHQGVEPTISGRLRLHRMGVFQARVHPHLTVDGAVTGNMVPPHLHLKKTTTTLHGTMKQKRQPRQRGNKPKKKRSEQRK